MIGPAKQDDRICAETAKRLGIERLRAAGVDVTFDLVTGAPYGLENGAAGTTSARELVDRAQTWLASQLNLQLSNA